MSARRSMWALGLAMAICAPTVAVAAPPTLSFTDLDDFSSNPAYAAFYQQQITFSSTLCPDDYKDLVECARVKAPLDWNNPALGTIDVAIGRKVGATPDGKRLLLSSPGGPGAEGVTYGALTVPSLFPAEGHYSIGIDPRGTGNTIPLTISVPAQQPDFRSDGDARTYDRAGIKAAIDNRVAINTAASNHRHAPYVNTVQTARDFNLVRAVLGFTHSDYVGFSYGTWLGATVAKMFPNTFDRVILDGNMDWQHPNFDAAFRHQVPGAQVVVDRFLLPYLARHHDRYGLGSTTAQVNATVERLRANLTDPVTKRGVADKVEQLQMRALGSHFYFDAVGKAFQELHESMRRGATPTQLIAVMNEWMPDGPPSTDQTFNVSQTAVVCSDTSGEQDAWAAFRRAEVDLRQRPVMAAENLIPMCVGWTGPTSTLPRDIVERPLKQVLMLQQEADPSTPYPQAYASWQAHPRSRVRMVNVDDLSGHGSAYLYSACAAAPVFAYLKNGSFATTDVSCQAEPLRVMEYPFTGGVIQETASFEVLNLGTPTSLPKPALYVMRDLTDPVPDASTAKRNDKVSVAASERTSTLSSSVVEELKRRWEASARQPKPRF